MNAQEIFDKVARHLLTQNRPARDVYSDNCRYRTENGLKCAVGCLIPDDKYTPEIENVGISWLLVPTTSEEIIRKRRTLRELLSDLGLLDHCDLLTRLQEIHDDFDPEEWADELRDAAFESELNPAVLEEFAQ